MAATRMSVSEALVRWFIDTDILPSTEILGTCYIREVDLSIISMHTGTSDDAESYRPTHR